MKNGLAANFDERNGIRCRRVLRAEDHAPATECGAWRGLGRHWRHEGPPPLADASCAAVAVGPPPPPKKNREPDPSAADMLLCFFASPGPQKNHLGWGANNKDTEKSSGIFLNYPLDPKER